VRRGCGRSSAQGGVDGGVDEFVKADLMQF